MANKNLDVGWLKKVSIIVVVGLFSVFSGFGVSAQTWNEPLKTEIEEWYNQTGKNIYIPETDGNWSLKSFHNPNPPLSSTVPFYQESSIKRTTTSSTLDNYSSEDIYKLGLAYEFGIAISKNPYQAIRLFEIAGKKGNSDALYKLGNLYERGEGAPSRTGIDVDFYSRGGKGVPSSIDTAISYYRRASGEGNEDAAYRLGVIYSSGEKVPQDVAESLRWYKIASGKGSSSSSYSLGHIYRTGSDIMGDIEVKRDYTQAIKFYKRSAEQGYGGAFWVGYMYYLGLGVDRNLEEAVEWFIKSKESERKHSGSIKFLDMMTVDGEIVLRDFTTTGEVEAQLQLGHMFAGGGRVTDRFEAVRWYRLAAEQNNSQAQYLLGWMYCLGQGVEEDDKKGKEYLLLAVNQGNEGAVLRFGYAYYSGICGEQDYTEAARWYKVAADQENPEAFYRLGAMYQEGTGVIQNYSRAIDYFMLSAKGQNGYDNKYALGSLFDMFLDGQGTSDDFSEFVSFLEHNIEKCYLNLYYTLGHGYYAGKVLETNLVKAHMSFNIASLYLDASSRKQKESEELRDEISEMLTQEELSQAQDLAMEEYERCL